MKKILNVIKRIKIINNNNINDLDNEKKNVANFKKNKNDKFRTFFRKTE